MLQRHRSLRRRSIGKHILTKPYPGAVFQLFWKIMQISQLRGQGYLIGRENLVANDYLWDTAVDCGQSPCLYAGLPQDHWHSEVMNWMNTSLAMMQRSTIAFARPRMFEITLVVSMLNYVISPTDLEERSLCNSMKARSQAHMSFSVLGLSLTLGLGAFIITANPLLPNIVEAVQGRTRKGMYKRLEWIENSSFQLQRMAAEGRGVGPWNGRDEDVPKLVEEGQKFNLTAMSLGTVWSQGDCWEGGEGEMKGFDEESGSMEHMGERGGHAKRSRKGQNDGAWLLYE